MNVDVTYCLYPAGLSLDILEYMQPAFVLSAVVSLGDSASGCDDAVHKIVDQTGYLLYLNSSDHRNHDADIAELLELYSALGWKQQHYVNGLFDYLIREARLLSYSLVVRCA